MTNVRKAAIIGGGVIGGGWAARFLLNGWDVGVFDPDPDAERKIAGSGQRPGSIARTVRCADAARRAS